MISNSTSERLLTIEDMVLLLQLSKRTIWRMRSAGRLPNSIRMGGSIRWRSTEIERWIAQGCPDIQGEKKR